MSLPAGVEAAVGPVASSTPVAGGDLNDAWALELADGTRAFAKTGQPGSYEVEAAGLRWMAEAGTTVPTVLAVTTDALVLSWIENGPIDAEALGRMVATLHLAGAGDFGVLPPGTPGGDRADLRLGPLGIGNEPEPDWPAFYAQHRIFPLLGAAGLDAEGRRVMDQVCERLPALAGPPEPPARLHGDLWSGNVMGGPVLIDPAAHGGHREVDLAMLTLFGSPGERFFAAYEEVAPLADGWRERESLWQLFPLLVHATLFGGGYGARAVAAARRYL